MRTPAEMTTCTDPTCPVCAGYAEAIEAVIELYEERGDQERADWWSIQLMERGVAKGERR